ncbi:Protein arginine N-methyltransferase 5 [Blattella germanica]|nr:Protein arginine N-methyltransferase 5 [Blattella germanica]
MFSNQDWNNLIVGKLSPYINVDSADPIVRKLSEEALNQELSYASHLGLPAIMFTLRNGNETNLARILHNKMQAGSTYQIWLHLPIENPVVAASCYRSDEDHLQKLKEGKELDTWEWWNKFRSVCNFEKKLGIALEMTTDIPSEEEITRWIGEPIKCLVLPTALFVTNKKGYPVLLRPHQNLIKSLAHLDVQVVIRGAIRHGSSKFYQQYLDHLWQNTVHTDPLVAYARGYEDYLQCPLQPLMDNLESQTYEVFEKDPVKYNEYQRAIYCALLDRIPFEEKNTKVV